jgi:Zinc finger, ZZ type/PB1 domain
MRQGRIGVDERRWRFRYVLCWRQSRRSFSVTLRYFVLLYVVDSSAVDSSSVVYRKMKFPFIAHSYPPGRLNCDGYLERIRQTALEMCKGAATDLIFLYLDRDGDQILIATDEDLVEAIREYAPKEAGRVLRISARIMTKGLVVPDAKAPVTAVAKPAPVEPKEAPVTPKATPPSSSTSQTSGTQTESAAVSIKSTQTEVKETKPKATPSAKATPTPTPSTKTTPAPAEPSPLAESLNGVVASLVTELASATIALSGHVQQASERVARRACSVKEKNKRKSAESVAPTVPVPPTPTVVPTPPPTPPTPEQHPFIHGRHTCDACLETPIVGKRYHAVNIPDYDLCETCVSKHTSTAVQYVVEECGAYRTVVRVVSCSFAHLLFRT